MGANPGTVRREIVNTVPHPREYRATDFLRMVERIHDVVAGVHLPEARRSRPRRRRCPGAAPPAPSFRSRPCRIGEILGLLEILADHGGTMNLFDIDAITEYDFGQDDRRREGRRAARLRRHAEERRRPDGLRPEDGQRLDRRAARAPARQLLTLGTFCLVIHELAKDPDTPVAAEAVRDLLAARLPTVDASELFETVVNWGRAGQLFEFDAAADTIALFSGREEAAGG